MFLYIIKHYWCLQIANLSAWQEAMDILNIKHVQHMTDEQFLYTYCLDN